MPRQNKSRTLLMKRIGIVFGVILLGLVGAALVAPVLIDWKPMVTTAASEALGRQLTIDGDLSVSLIPGASVAASQIRLANAKGMAEPRMATIERIDATIRLLPLLGGRLALDQLEIINPDIRLEIAADGAPNWRFEPAARPSPKPEETAGKDLPLQDIALEGVRVRGGRIVFIDHRTDQIVELSDLSLSMAAATKGASPAELIASLSGQAEIAFSELSLPTGPIRQLRDAKASLEVPPDGGAASLNLEATAARDGEDALPLVLALRTSHPSELLAEGADPFELAGELGSVRVDLSGSLSGIPQELMVAIEADSLAALNQLLDAELPDLRPAALSAQLTLAEKRYKVAGLSVRLGASDLSGDLEMTLEGERPTIEGRLTSARLDLVAARPPGAAAAAPDTAPKRSRSHVFSDTPLPLGVLREVDADLTLLVGELRLDEGLTLDDVHLPLVLKAGRLASKPIEAGLFGGRLQGSLAVDAAPEVPTIELALDAQRIAIKGVLGRIALFEPRNATARLSLDLRTAGRSPREFAAGAGGHAELSAEGGVLNLGAAGLLTIGLADILRPLLGGSSETRLECLLVRYRLQDGVARSDAQVLSTNSFAVVGGGKVDLRTEEIDLHFATQSHSPSLMSFAVPFQVSGTLGNPKAGPDAEGSLVSVFKVAGSLVNPVYALSVLAPGERPPTGQSACVAAIEQAEGGIVERATGAAAGVATGVIEGAGDVLEGVGGALKGLFDR